MKRIRELLIYGIIVLLPLTVIIEYLGLFHVETYTLAEILIIVFSTIILAISLILDIFDKRIDEILVVSIICISYFVLNTFLADDNYTAVVGNGFNYEGLLVNIGYIGIAYACSRIKDDRYIRMLLAVFGLFEAAIGFLQSVVHLPFFIGTEVSDGELINAFGTIFNSNPYGQLLAMLSAYELGLFFFEEKKKQKNLYFSLMLIFLIALVLSDCRAGMLGFVLTGIYLAFLFGRTTIRNHMKESILIIIVGIVVFGAYLLFTSKGQNLAERIYSDFANLWDNPNALGSGRVGIWKKVWDEFIKRPIFGHGISNLTLMYFVGTDLTIVYVAHNDFLDILVNQGIIGLMLYIVFVALFIRKYANLSYNNKTKNLPYLCGVCVFLIASLFGWRIIYLTPYYYIFLGMISRKTDKMN